MQFLATVFEREASRVVTLLPTTAFALDAPSEDALSLYKLSLIKAKANNANGIVRSNIFLVDVILIFVGISFSSLYIARVNDGTGYWKRER